MSRRFGQAAYVATSLLSLLSITVYTPASAVDAGAAGRRQREFGRRCWR
jgi:hypothetical protein